MENKHSNLLKREDGAVAVVVALLMVVLMGFAAFVVDYGYHALVQRKLQTAADAAALAAAQEIIYRGNGLNVADVQAKLIDFIEKNGIQASEILPFPDSEINLVEGYVKVALARKTDFFFGRIFGLSSATRRANAKAKIVFLTSLSRLAPFGVVDVRPETIRATLGGKVAELTDSDKDGVFTGSMQAPLLDGSYKLAVEAIDDLSGQVVAKADASVLVSKLLQITSVKLDPLMAAPGQQVSVSTKVFGILPPVYATAFGSNYQLTDPDGDGTYTGSFSIPQGTADGSYGVGIKAGPLGLVAVNPAAYLNVSETFTAVKDIGVDPTSVLEGGVVNVSVRIGGFEFGKLASLVQDDKATTGKFMALELDNEGANEYGENILDGSEQALEIGDLVWAKTGVMDDQTKAGLSNRIGGDSQTWEDWNNLATRDYDSPRVITVPLVAATGYEEPGKKQMKVRGFATYFIENNPWETSESKVKLTGRFIEFPSPGKKWQTKAPGGGVYIKAARLIPY